MDSGTPRLDDNKMRLSLLALTASDATYSKKDGPSNGEKLACVRDQLLCPNCDIFTEFPYQELYDDAGAAAFQAAFFLCDLRIQALDRLISEAHGEVADHLQRRLINLSWKVRFRERLNLHNMVVTLNDDSIH